MDGKIKKLYKIVLTGGKNDPPHTYRRYYELIVITYCVSKPISSYQSKVGSGWVPTFRLLTTPPLRISNMYEFFFLEKSTDVVREIVKNYFRFYSRKDG